MDSLQNLPYLYRVALWQTLTWGSGYLIARSRRLSPGSARLLIALPLVILNFLLPQLFDGQKDIFTAIIAFMNNTGVANTKVLAWVMNRGPLALPWLTPGQVAATYVLTINPANPHKGDPLLEQFNVFLIF